jgi:hypothetical protein
MFGPLFVGKRVLREPGVRLVIGKGERGIPMRNVLNSGSLSVRDLSEELNMASNTSDSFPAE